MAFVLLTRLSRLHLPEIDQRFFSMLFVVTYVAGYFGARLYSLIIEDLSVVSISDVFLGLTQFGSMTFYGGALGAFSAGTIYTLVKRVPVPYVFDVAIPPALLALSVGRLGCFLNGDDYGKPIQLLNNESPPVWSVVFPNLGDGVARYPVQLVSFVGALSVALALVFFFRRLQERLGVGCIGYLGVSIYAVGRFIIEFFRGDERGVFIAGVISPAQVTSLFILACVTLTLPSWVKKWRILPIP